MTTDQASLWIQFFQRRFLLLPDRENLITLWHNLVKTIAIKGLRSYDARLVAAMQSYGIPRILTFNIDHLKKFSVTVLDPGSI